MSKRMGQFNQCFVLLKYLLKKAALNRGQKKRKCENIWVEIFTHFHGRKIGIEIPLHLVEFVVKVFLNKNVVVYREDATDLSTFSYYWL